MVRKNVNIKDMEGENIIEPKCFEPRVGKMILTPIVASGRITFAKVRKEATGEVTEDERLQILSNIKNLSAYRLADD